MWQEYSWCKHVTFDEFCEYILPYRIGNEKLTNWRKEYMTLYSSSLDSIKTDDPVIIARHLREMILKEKGNPKFTMIKPVNYPSLDAFTAEYFNGSCDDIAQFTLFLFRTVGIPCTIDYMPVKSDRNVGHSWVSLKNNKGELYQTDFFSNIEYISEHSGNRTYPKVKVYSKTFSKNTKAINKMLKITNSVPFEFDDNNYRFLDVTYLYSNYITNIEIPTDSLYSNRANNKLVYLCMPSWLNWIPVDWSIKENDKFVFNIESGSIVRLATYENEKLNFICDPFIVHRQSRKILSFSPQKERESITLFSKFSIDGELNFRNRMVNGVFEGSNNSQFKDADTLYTIKEVPFRLFTQVFISPDKEYRYVRYKGPLNSHCNVAEVQFFSDTTYLRGDVLGTPGAWGNSESHEYTNVFDGSTDTSFDHKTSSDGWSGLDLSVPTKITKIVYTPRNYANYIKKGQKYELFFSSKNGWESLGIQTPKSDSLYYDNAPVGTLYYLKNYSEGNQERVFYMEDDKPIFK